MSEAMNIGQPHPRGDARDKAAGREKYAADYYPENTVWAGAVRAGVAHGRLVSVDTADARADRKSVV